MMLLPEVLSGGGGCKTRPRASVCWCRGWGGTALLVIGVLACMTPSTLALDAKELVVVVLSQTDRLSREQGQELRNDLKRQAIQESNQEPPMVHLLHEDFPTSGAWTVVPILPRLAALHSHNSSWLLVCEPRTRVNLPHLIKLLGTLDHRKPIWLGHALHDKEPTIIHHFALLDKPSQRFQYPHFAAGFAMSVSLLNKLVSRINNGDLPHIDFSIDTSHELTLFISDEGRGPALNHSEHLCVTPGLNCATYPAPFIPCGEPVAIHAMYFAVKTCSKFHHDRVPVVLKTWAPHAEHLTLYSDVSDPSIPQLLNLGVPNTEQGHCGKTMAILHHVAAKLVQQPQLQWLVLADDDTIFSVARLQQLLSCYESRTSEPPLLALGERYGYRVRESHGYNYITGGGGTVLSRDAVIRLTVPRACECPAPSAPDDMFLGLCLARLGIDIIHSPFFHQARPLDYAPEYLTAQQPVSFHKHWMIDPIKVYKTWFEAEDSKLSLNQLHPPLNSHLEL